MSKKYLIIAVAAALVLAAGVYYFLPQKTNKPAVSNEAQPATSTESAVLSNLGSEKPLEKMPDINPASKANPFKNVKANPFE